MKRLPIADMSRAFVGSGRKRSTKSILDVGDRLLVVAPSGGGKTNLLRNMITRRGFLPGIERVEVITASADDYTPIAEKLNEAAEADVVHIQSPEETDPDMSIEELEGQDKPAFVILDDILGHPRVGRILEQVATHGRHANAIFATATQSTKGITTTVRANSNHICVFPGLMNGIEERNAYMLVPGDLSRDEFRDKLAAVRASGPYSFLLIRRHETGPNRYWLNFERPI